MKRELRMQHIDGNHYRVSDASAKRLADTTLKHLPKWGMQIDVELPDGQRAVLQRTFGSTSIFPKRGWVWAIYNFDPRSLVTLETEYKHEREGGGKRYNRKYHMNKPVYDDLGRPFKYDAHAQLAKLRRKQSGRDPGRPMWNGLDHNEKQASMWHNKLVHIILYGIDARGREHLAEAETKLSSLLEQRAPGNQKHRIQRWWENKKTELRRQWKEAEEVARGERKPKLGER